MMDNYEFQDPWLKSQFEKAYSDGEAEGKAMLARDLVRQIGAGHRVDLAEAAIEAADVEQLTAWVVELSRGEVPSALRRH
jgi:hypothetical protein